MESLDKVQSDQENKEKETSKETYSTLLKVLKKWANVNKHNSEYIQGSYWLHHGAYRDFHDKTMFTSSHQDYKRFNEDVQSILKARDVLAKYSPEAADELLKKYLAFLIDDFVTNKVDDYLASAFEIINKKIL